MHCWRAPNNILPRLLMTENKKNLLAGFKFQLKAALLIQGVELLIF
jgi:hypothetical protein